MRGFCLALTVLSGLAPMRVQGQLVEMSHDYPRVMVVLQEDGGEIASNLFTAFFKDAGFPVIDPAYARSPRERALAVAALGGDDGAAVELGRNLGAQVLILGSVHTDTARITEALLTGTASLAVRSLRLDIPRVVSVASAEGREADVTDRGVRDRAVRAAVNDILFGGGRLIGDLSVDWDETPWSDGDYWASAPGGTASQPGKADIVILESFVFRKQLRQERSEDERTDQERIGFTIEPRQYVHIRGFVSAPGAQVTVDSTIADTRSIGGSEAAELGIDGPGTGFTAQVPWPAGGAGVRITATSSGAESSVEVLPEARERWAVVIGISDYADRRIRDLEFADDDARAIYEFLSSPAGGSVPKSNMMLLVNEAATGVSIRHALFEFLQGATRDDLVTIYVAAHGSPDPGRPENLYLLPYDARLDSLASTAFPMWDVKTAARRQIAAERVVVLADACRSEGTLDADPNRIGMAFSDLFSSSRRLTLSASGIDESSHESRRWGGGHGVFTHHLLEGLAGAADADSNGIVMFSEAASYVRERVTTDTGGDQTPKLSGRGDIPLARPEAGREHRSPETHEP